MTEEEQCIEVINQEVADKNQGRVCTEIDQNPAERREALNTANLLEKVAVAVPTSKVHLPSKSRPRKITGNEYKFFNSAMEHKRYIE